jgi:hypothetical protein
MQITVNLPRVEVHVTMQHDAGVLEELKHMTAGLTRLVQEVTETKDAIASLKQFNAGIAQQLRDLKDDPAAIEQLANDLDSEQAGIAEHILENTPAAPEA